MTQTYNSNVSNYKSNPLKKTLFFILLVLSILIFFYFNNSVKADQFIDPRESAVESVEIAELLDIDEYNLVDDFGAIPDDNIDDSNALQEALNMATTKPIRLIIPAGVYLSTGDGFLEAMDVKGIHIKGDGAIFKPENPMVNPLEYYFMKLFMAEDNVGVLVEGVTVDGSLNPQDLYFTLDNPEDVFDLQTQRGFYISGAENVSFNNVNFQHMYGGYTIHLDEYSNVNIKNIRITDVGGDDITDSFGGALFFGAHEGDATINIDNVHADGKVSPRDPSYTAWIGIVFENGSIQLDDKDKWIIDKNTTINVTNSSFIDYETTFHVESIAGNIYFNSDNVRTRAKDYFIAAGINGELRERNYNLSMEMSPWGRNGIIHGLYYTEKEREDNISGKNKFNMYNAVVYYITLEGTPPIPVATSYGDSVQVNYHNITLTNVPSKLVMNGTAVFIDSMINLHPDSLETADSLASGYFSEPDYQYVEYQGETEVNVDSNHQTATEIDKPQWYVPSGYNAPELSDPIESADLEGEDEP